MVIDKIDHKNANQWIYSILEGKKEIELKIFEDEDFILNKDWEFNDGDLDTFYCLAMPK